MLNVNQTSQILQFLQEAKRFVCITHANPDGDALGSQLGLAEILRLKFPGKEILRICHDAAPRAFQFLPAASLIRQDYAPLAGDLVFFLDAAEPKLTEMHESHPALFLPEDVKKNGMWSVKIDHHRKVADFSM